MAGVKHCLLIIALVALMGCGESKEVVEAKAAAKTKADAEAKAAAEAQAAAEARAIAEATEQSAIIEQAIRFSLKKFTGQLTQADLENVRELLFVRTKISDASLGEVVKLNQLTLLNLEFTQITDAGLIEVAKLQQLEWLFLGNTRVTKAGVAQLKKSLKKSCLILPEFSP